MNLTWASKFCEKLNNYFVCYCLRSVIWYGPCIYPSGIVITKYNYVLISIFRHWQWAIYVYSHAEHDFIDAKLSKCSFPSSWTGLYSLHTYRILLSNDSRLSSFLANNIDVEEPLGSDLYRSGQLYALNEG